MAQSTAATPATAASVARAKRVVVSLAVNFELNTSNGLRKVIFGLEKDTKPEGVVEWQIHFTLFERAKRTDPFGDAIVKLDVKVDIAEFHNAEALAHSKPSPEQAGEIVGPVAEDAKAVKSGDLEKADFDASAQSVMG